MPAHFKKILSFLGIIAPLYFFILVTIIGPLWKGYDFVKEYISSLGSNGSPYSLFVNIFGFCLFGLMIIGFAFALSARIKKSRYSKTATILLALGGLLIFILGFFPTDRYGTFTVHGKIHDFTASLAFILTPLGLLFYGLAFEAERREKFLQFISLLFGLVAVFCVIWLFIDPFFSYAGTIERLGIGAILVWISLVSMKLSLDDKLLRAFEKN